MDFKVTDTLELFNPNELCPEFDFLYKPLKELQEITEFHCSRNSFRFSNVADNFESDLVIDAWEGIYSVKIWNNSLLAFIDNYGMGSKMAKSNSQNPWLDEYKNDERFNPNRNGDMAIVARPEGEYTTWDWVNGGTKTLVGSGIVTRNGKPLNLEKSKIHPVKPLEPNFWLEETLKFSLVFAEYHTMDSILKNIKLK